MSSSTSSRSTLTITPSTMSPSLKYLIVSSIAARKSSAEPMSLTATCLLAPAVAAADAAGSVVLIVLAVMRVGAPKVDRDRAGARRTRGVCRDLRRPASGGTPDDVGGTASGAACSVRGRAGPQRAWQSTFAQV